ncbi:hypothetical protein PI125_g1186 [Phytophthora idaei]|nr:hypothetical protein PI125_g1186 [Phytophthora idaei]
MARRLPKSQLASVSVAVSLVTCPDTSACSNTMVPEHECLTDKTGPER